MTKPQPLLLTKTWQSMHRHESINYRHWRRPINQMDRPLQHRRVLCDGGGGGYGSGG